MARQLASSMGTAIAAAKEDVAIAGLTHAGAVRLGALTRLTHATSEPCTPKERFFRQTDLFRHVRPSHLILLRRGRRANRQAQRAPRTRRVPTGVLRAGAPNRHMAQVRSIRPASRQHPRLP
jgi:hypothetical protein